MAEAYAWPSIGDRTEAILERMMENRRPPSPDYDARGEEDRESLKDLIKQTLRASVEIQGGYHEDGGNQWSKWLVPGIVTLIVMGIGGGIAMYGQLSALTQRVENLQAQVDRVEKIVEPRYRGQ
jgi:hypothetical protein